MSIIQSLFGNARKFASVLKGDRHEELEFDFSESDLGEQSKYFDVATKKDLPGNGKSTLTYRTLDDMLLWNWKNGVYVEYNPYAFGITQQFNEHQLETIVASNVAVLDVDNRKLVLDDVSHVPSISLDDVRKGADPRMAILYNVQALREDLRVIGNLKMTFNSMVKKDKVQPYNRNSDNQNVLDNWFFQNHSTLSLLLRSACQSSTYKIDVSIIDCLNGLGAHLFWDSKAGNAKFKDGEFEVNL